MKHLLIFLFVLSWAMSYGQGQNPDPTVRIDVNLRHNGVNGLSRVNVSKADSLRWNAGTGSGGGATPTFTIGTVTTGSQPSVTITGTPPNYTLNIVLQQGPAGQQGATGSSGATPTFSIGTITALAFGQSPTVTLSGTAPNYVLNIGLPAGAPGADGRTILSGTTAPSSGIGANGDFYINTATLTLYGPKASGNWPTGISLVGSQGATGSTGATGANGLDGKTVLNGTTAPGSGIGTNGDFYINTQTNTLYGPKASGAWPAGVSLVGPAGSGGSTPIANNLTTTTTGSALDAVQGKTLKDLVDTHTTQIAGKQNTVALTTTGSGAATFNPSTGALNIPTPSGGSSTSITAGSGISVTGSPTNYTVTALPVDLYTDSTSAGAYKSLSGDFTNASPGKVDSVYIATKLWVNPKLAAKQNKVTLTTTGTGAATFNQTTGALNIPTPSGGGSSTPVYSNTAVTKAEFQRVINEVGARGKVTLMPGTYDISGGNVTASFVGKPGVTIDGTSGVVFSFGSTDRLLINGSSSGLTINGIAFSCTATTGNTVATGQGLLDINEQGSHDNMTISNCTFTSPQCLRNGVSVNTYSALADGGNGAKSNITRLKFRKSYFISLGRMGVEVLNHTWSDNLTDVLVNGVDVEGCEFFDLGKIAESNGTTFNGMIVSVSGRSTDFRYVNNGAVDAKTYGLELVGVNGGVVTGNTFNYINNSVVQVSLADGYGNGADATQNITIGDNYMRSKNRPLNARGTTNLNLDNNTMIVDVIDNSNLSSVYLQKCTGVTFRGGSITTGSYNPLRMDDCKEVVVDVPRITSTNTNNYASISIYGGSGYAGAGSATIRLGIATGIFKKANGITTTPSAIYETIGGANVTDVTTDVPVVAATTTRQTVTSGSSSTIASATGTIEYYIDPSSTLAAHTVTLPATPVDNQRVTFHFGGTISTGTVVSSFTVLANTGQTLVQALALQSLQSNEALSIMFNQANNKWYRSY